MKSRSKRKTSEDWLIGHGREQGLVIGNKPPLKECYQVLFTHSQRLEMSVVVYEELSNIMG